MADENDKDLTYHNLQNAIDKQFGNTATVIGNGDGTFTVLVHDSAYDISSNGTITQGINWKRSMQNAQAPDTQKTTPKNIIGIGTDGTPVNMDLWEYTIESDKSYHIKYMSENFSDNGEIIGTIPQYIKTPSNEQFLPVTSMLESFMGMKGLQIAPKIPNTVTNLQGTFKDCTNLTASILPSNVITMIATFQNCSSLSTAPNLPENVEDISWAFYHCSNLKIAPIIPNSVKNMKSTFNQCINLTRGSDIPENVENMQYTYMGCSKLSGELKISANISGKELNGHQDYYQCFWNAATSEDFNLTIICSKKTYQILSTSQLLYSSNSNITIKE